MPLSLALPELGFYVRERYATTWPMGGYGWARYPHHDLPGDEVLHYWTTSVYVLPDRHARIVAACTALDEVDLRYRRHLPTSLEYYLEPDTTTFRAALLADAHGDPDAHDYCMRLRGEYLGAMWVRAAALARACMPSSAAPASPVPWHPARLHT